MSRSGALSFQTSGVRGQASRVELRDVNVGSVVITPVGGTVSSGYVRARPESFSSRGSERKCRHGLYFMNLEEKARMLEFEGATIGQKLLGRAGSARPFFPSKCSSCFLDEYEEGSRRDTESTGQYVDRVLRGVREDAPSVSTRPSSRSSSRGSQAVIRRGPLPPPSMNPARAVLPPVGRGSTPGVLSVPTQLNRHGGWEEVLRGASSSVHGAGHKYMAPTVRTAVSEWRKGVRDAELRGSVSSGRSAGSSRDSSSSRVRPVSPVTRKAVERPVTPVLGSAYKRVPSQPVGYRTSSPVARRGASAAGSRSGSPVFGLRPSSAAGLWPSSPSKVSRSAGGTAYGRSGAVF